VHQAAPHRFSQPLQASVSAHCFASYQPLAHWLFLSTALVIRSIGAGALSARLLVYAFASQRHSLYQFTALLGQFILLSNTSIDCSPLGIKKPR